LDRHLNTAALICFWLVAISCFRLLLEPKCARITTARGEGGTGHSDSAAFVCLAERALRCLGDVATGAKPITMWRDRDAAWTDVVMGFARRSVENQEQKRKMYQEYR